MWRPEDEALLERLEDEVVLERLFFHHVGSLVDRGKPHPRAAGLIASIRKLPGGAESVSAALGGDVAPLARFVEAAPMTDRPAVMLHHLALYFGKVARALEESAPDAAANAWMRALAAWLALGEERRYLAELETKLLGDAAPNEAKSSSAASRTHALERPPALIPPERVPLELVEELGRRAAGTSRDLAPSGRAALLALGWTRDAARIAGVPDDAKRRAEQAAERQRNAALEAALGVVGEALDEANVRGELTKVGRSILLRAMQVWAWSGQDEAAEQFIVDRLTTIGWELYRARDWDALRHTFDPFRRAIESFARRIEQDSSNLAFSSPCAQMFVFLTDVEPNFAKKLELAERAVRLCPTHRNGRLNLASLLCDEAIEAMRSMVVFARRDELDRVQATLARAEALYPQTRELPEAKAMLERVKRGRIAL